MNVQLSPAELTELRTITLSRRDKLLRLAQIVRAAPHPIFMFSNIEYMGPVDKRMASHPNSAFGLAAADPVLKDAGLQGASVAEGERFFELSRDELHAFSCDCGGHISNETMGRRIELLAYNR